MPWACRMVPMPESRVARQRLRPGDMWLAPYVLEEHEREHGELLSRKYFAEHAAHRPPIVMVLPNGSHWIVDGRAYGVVGKDPGGKPVHGYHGDGWTITGEPPSLTAAPSINYVGSYHGHLALGWITDDNEGRAQAHREYWIARDAEHAAGK